MKYRKNNLKYYQKTKKQLTFKTKTMKSKESPLKRINRVMKFYYLKGVNKELVNRVYRNVIKQRL